MRVRDGAIGGNGERDHHKTTAGWDSGEREYFPDVELPAGGAMDDLGWWPKTPLGQPDHLAGKIFQLVIDHPGPVLVPEILEQIHSERITAKQRY